MAILTVRHAPDPVLRAPAARIPTITPEIRRLAQDMIETMYAAGGVGLAANQVGASCQLFVASPAGESSPDQQRGRELVLVNPVIIARRGRIRIEEGCLSVPGVCALVTRAAVVRIRGRRLDGREVELEGQELLARIVQHEVDHLRGLLFPHRLPWWTRRLLWRQYARQQRELARVQIP